MRRLPELDAIRGLAALGIVAFHFGPELRLGRLTYLGQSGLELFFVLSGFLITSIVLAHGCTAAPRDVPSFFLAFWWHRVLRIWPIYYGFILCCAAAVAVARRAIPLDALAYYLTFLQNAEQYWGGRVHVLAYPVTATWSLAVEQQFYVIWPVLVLLSGPGRVVPMSCAVVVAAVGARWAGLHPWLLPARCDGFALGAVLAAATADPAIGRQALARRLALVGSGCFAYLLLGIPAMGGRPFDPFRPGAMPFDLTATAALFACVIGLVVLHSGHPALAPLRGRSLRYAGTISYGLYLYHTACLSMSRAFVAAFHLPSALAPAVLAPGLTLALAAASWAWIESPVLRLKHLCRYGPRRAPKPSGLSPSVLDAGHPGVIAPARNLVALSETPA